MACLFWMTFLKGRTSGWMDELTASADVKVKDLLKHQARLFFFGRFLSGNWWLKLVGTLCKFIHHSGLWLLHDHKTAMKPRESEAHRLIFSHLEEALTSQTRGVSFSSEDASLPWLVGLVFLKETKGWEKKIFRRIRHWDVWLMCTTFP